MGSFEQACADTERAALAAVQATKAQVAAAKALAKAAAEGDIGKIHKAVDRLRVSAVATRQEVLNAGTAWPLGPDDEEELLRSGYADELMAEARSAGFDIHQQDGRLLAFPSVVRILSGQRAVQINRKRVTALRPSRLVAQLKATAARKPRQSPERFIEVLHDAYRLVVSADNEGTGTTLLRIYDALTLMPDVRKDYSPSDFTRDVFLLDRSNLRRTKSGAELFLPSATGTKGSRILEFVDPNGHPITYFGIRFA